MKGGYSGAALAALADRLESCGAHWVVGGSTGLSIRGAELDRAPRDLDIYTDENQIPIMHAKLMELAMDMPTLSETELYRSVLAHYNAEGTVVELVGGFRVTALSSSYRTDVSAILYPQGDSVQIDGREVRLVPLGHELLFNLLREREDRAEAAGSLMRLEPEKHFPVLEKLLAANSISPEVAAKARRYAGGREDGR
ncbi:nucleotidyltransferase domain-containing protein [Cohnella faecalis]|uniref:Nucleotidyltransferase family protein n=1 Tax=Cohnella faecalis TaxID=2315694 RepID=A0A398CQ37_9BACL|nr:hypothetical protein [Cohnella faecalis]RIE04633.1 hypothetical protein D3H35_03835 [Cohnella faecalis]